MTAPTRPNYRYGQYDPSNVDELAVEFVCNGTPMELNRDELTVATKRLAGKCPSTEIARRCRTDDRTVVRILNGLGATKCPHCCQLLFVDAAGAIPDHVDYRRSDRCPGTGTMPRGHQVAS